MNALGSGRRWRPTPSGWRGMATWCWCPTLLPGWALPGGGKRRRADAGRRPPSAVCCAAAQDGRAHSGGLGRFEGLACVSAGAPRGPPGGDRDSRILLRRASGPLRVSFPKRWPRPPASTAATSRPAMAGAHAWPRCVRDRRALSRPRRRGKGRCLPEQMGTLHGGLVRSPCAAHRRAVRGSTARLDADRHPDGRASCPRSAAGCACWRCTGACFSRQADVGGLHLRSTRAARLSGGGM